MDFALLNTEETIARLLSLIRDAQRRVVLVSPYVTLGAEDRVGHAIRDALARGVTVQVVIRADDQTVPKQQWLESVKPLVASGLRLCGARALHAKLYCSESVVLVTSLNLLESSFLNTVEVGLWSKEPAAVLAVHDFMAKHILQHTHLLDVDGAPRTTTQPSHSEKDTARGYCIRCRGEIPLNPRRPYCRQDFDDWANWGDEDFADAYCHECGRKYRATMRRPRCEACFGERG